MCRERDSRGRFVARGGSSIPTTPPTPPRLRRDTPPFQAHIPSHRPPEVQFQKFNQEDLLLHLLRQS